MPEMLRSPEAQARSVRRLKEERELKESTIDFLIEISILRISKIFLN